MTKSRKQVESAEKLTGEIVQLVTKHIPQPHGHADLEAILLSIGMAYASFVSAFHTKNEARKLLMGLAYALDDPDFQTKIRDLSAAEA